MQQIVFYVEQTKKYWGLDLLDVNLPPAAYHRLRGRRFFFPELPAGFDFKSLTRQQLVTAAGGRFDVSATFSKSILSGELLTYDKAEQAATLLSVVAETEQPVIVAHVFFLSGIERFQTAQKDFNAKYIERNFNVTRLTAQTALSLRRVSFRNALITLSAIRRFSEENKVSDDPTREIEDQFDLQDFIKLNYSTHRVVGPKEKTGLQISFEDLSAAPPDGHPWAIEAMATRRPFPYLPRENDDKEADAEKGKDTDKPKPLPSSGSSN